MKYQDRKIYIVLANEVDYLVCAFCKHGEFSGSICDAGSGEYSCNHPLWKVREDVAEDVQSDGPGNDCWGFKPIYPVEIVADIVGVIIANGFSSTAWFERGDGRIEVQGIKNSKFS